jgi:hypothetical protein
MKSVELLTRMFSHGQQRELGLTSTVTSTTNIPVVPPTLSLVGEVCLT